MRKEAVFGVSRFAALISILGLLAASCTHTATDGLSPERLAALARDEMDAGGKDAVTLGFEQVTDWKVAADGATLTAARDDRTEGAQALRVEPTEPEEGKIIVWSSVPRESLLQGYAAIKLDVKLDAQKAYPALVTLAFRPGPEDGTWTESTPRLLGPGWNRDITFSLLEPTWKTEAAGWAYRVVPGRDTPVNGVWVLVHGLDATEAVLIDNLRWCPLSGDTVGELDARAAKPAARSRPPRATVPAAREQESAALTRADRIRAYVLTTLHDYMLHLAQTGEAEEAALLGERIESALAAPLVPRELPAPPAPDARPMRKPAPAP